MLRLTERQKKMAGMLFKTQCTADIGCDHGRLGAYLIQSGLAGSVIAADISNEALNKARNLARRLGVEEQMQFRCGDGLKVLEKKEAQAAVIAGLSGVTIAGIMLQGREKERIYVLQPMSEAFRLREALFKMGFEILDEAVAIENRGRRRFYEIIKCRWDGLAREPEEKYLYIPKAPLVRREREMKEFLEYKLDVCKKVLNGVQRGDGRYGDRDAWFKKQAAFYEEGLICLK